MSLYYNVRLGDIFARPTPKCYLTANLWENAHLIQIDGFDGLLLSFKSKQLLLVPLFVL